MADHTFTADPGSMGITFTYVLDGDVDKVYAAYTDPDLIPKWWAPENTNLHVEKRDVKPGGVWKYVMSDGGQDFVFMGVYHTVDAPKRIVATWSFVPVPSVALETATFEELPGGKTKITEQYSFQSVEDRDSMMKSGMDEDSMVTMMERLAQLV